MLAANVIKEHKKKGDTAWDEEGWHYSPPARWPKLVRKERLAAYILALDAINFCFWPVQGYEYEDLATTLTCMARSDHVQQEELVKGGKTAISESYVFSAANLQSITVEKMKLLFQQHHSSNQVPPNMEQRCHLWNEVGSILLERFEGSAMTLVQTETAVEAVRLLVEHFPGFGKDRAGDTHFYKRAQICVGDWNAALHLNWPDMDQLTMFADYRVPQVLRHCSVLKYDDVLAEKVDTEKELPLGSSHEVAIRAASVTAVEWLVDELNKQDDSSGRWTAVKTDWYLWQVGERMQTAGELSPHHRVNTMYY
jgi:hypothetical protein